ncbi:hypothetical protein HJC23_005438 [Cyclotella cryptica]|uniref:VOC domain-containing protein n=1 Tax=Cyclotella cryptica TaxID=29204 RepID=A0ABD3P264_9STRA|eukprot:CCRYP_017918-RA/>CCRYP_017918-RA protein AED:0.14 eAED:0.14 QI:0/-1/0/1/-1/1/1/0/310
MKMISNIFMARVFLIFTSLSITNSIPTTCAFAMPKAKILCIRRNRRLLANPNPFARATYNHKGHSPLAFQQQYGCSAHTSRHFIQPSARTLCKATSNSDNNNDNTVTKSLTTNIYSHHIALKTRNIENAINFYSLLGFRVESKFVSGPARCAWLIHESHNDDQDPNTTKSRMELIEVPSYMLNEPEGMKRRAVDFTKREELLGWNHFALDVTKHIPRSMDDSNSQEGRSCELYQLQQWMDDLNEASIAKFGKSLRVALPPTKRIIGREVYEMAFLYDADGALVELLNHSGTLQQDVSDGWTPWDGTGFVQ